MHRLSWRKNVDKVENQNTHPIDNLWLFGNVFRTIFFFILLLKSLICWEENLKCLKYIRIRFFFWIEDKKLMQTERKKNIHTQSLTIQTVFIPIFFSCDAFSSDDKAPNWLCFKFEFIASFKMIASFPIFSYIQPFTSFMLLMFFFFGFHSVYVQVHTSYVTWIGWTIVCIFSLF